MYIKHTCTGVLPSKSAVYSKLGYLRQIILRICITSCHLSACVHDTAWCARLSPCASQLYGFILNSVMSSCVMGKLPWWHVKWCGKVLLMDSCLRSTVLSLLARLHRNCVTWSELKRVLTWIGAHPSYLRFKSIFSSSCAHWMMFTKSYFAQKLMNA